jgi:DNA-binding transcriptional LysR family regulator
MSKLPDLEALAIFAKVAEHRSFAGAAADLSLSKATVSKAVARLERKLGARLIHRTSRRLALTDIGRTMADHASAVLSAGEAAEADALALSSAPRGLVRLAAPMSFGLKRIAPLLPDFMSEYPDVQVDLHLSDAVVDLIGGGFDAALRIGLLADSSLRARRLCRVTRRLVAAPSYFARRGRPTHPSELVAHACIGYAYLPTPDIWRFSNSLGEVVAVRPSGPLRANNAEVMMPALLAGLGLAVQPDFVIEAEQASGALVEAMPDWRMSDSFLHVITPPGGPRPARVEALVDFLVNRLSPR